MVHIAIIGDVGGHFDALASELKRLGANNSLQLPADLRVIQVGDLIHRGGQDEQLIDYVDAQLRNENKQWIQLVGNHESYYLLSPRLFEWDDEISSLSQAKLQKLWDDGLLDFAASIKSADQDFLVTHAGLTYNFWDRRLGSPETAEDTARLINRFKEYGIDSMQVVGNMLQDRSPDLLSSPIWAEAGYELLPSWLGHEDELLFNQVHGHSNAYNVVASEWKNPQLNLKVEADLAKRQTKIEFGKFSFYEIDPEHGVEPADSWQALELDGEILTTV